MIKSSKTGKTVASLSSIIRYNQKQLQLYNANKLGEVANDVATEIYNFASTVKTLTKPEKAFVVGRLKVNSRTLRLL
jgi:chromosome segregation and condensation protein ScpB